MTSIQSVKGTREFYPEEMIQRQWIYSKIREVSEGFGYKEWDGPFLERLELYAAKSGEELVKEQSFVFPDRSGEMIALRPELTPSLARMIAAKKGSLGSLIRWWSFGPFWRYERPQKGRAREFFQWNIDLLGVDLAEADAEIAATGANFFEQVGLSDEQIKIYVNNRGFAEKQLESIGVRVSASQEVFKLIDRREKMEDKAWCNYAQDIGLSTRQIGDLMGILEDRTAWERSKELLGFFEAIDSLGMSRYVEYNPNIIRGLDYYTGTVFEAWDTDGEFRAILGGGRYDSLVSDVGGAPLPATGFAMGDVVLGLVLSKYDCWPESKENPSQILVATFNEELRRDALRLSSEMREIGFRVEWYPEADKLSKQFKYADRQGIPVVAVLGSDEIAAGTVTVKDLRDGQQTQVVRDQLGVELFKIL